MEEEKKELTHEELVEKEKREIQVLKEQDELGKLRLEKEALKRRLKENRIEGVKENLKSVGKTLGGLFEGIPALGTDLQPIDKKKEKDVTPTS